MENKPDTISTPLEWTTTKGVQYWIDKWNTDINAQNTEDVEHEIIEPKQLPPLDNEK